MTEIELLKKLEPQLLEVIKNNYLENEHQYDKFINYITSLLPIIEPKNVSLSDICSVFKSNLLNPLVENGLDEEGNELEDVLTIPKSGEPLIKSIKTKGWVTNEVELKLLNSTYYKLVKKNSGLESFVLNDITQNSLHILGRCNNPNDWISSKQGLVMGMVQSGKTVSMLSLISLAMGSGYNFFILLAGGKESLKVQTQDRIREMFGLNNGGYFEEIQNNVSIYSPTDTFSYIDLKGGGATNLKPRDPHNTIAPILILTILKESNNLKKLNKDIKEAEQFCKTHNIDFSERYKTLILDDESDYASLNVSKKSITAINKQLTNLRNNLPKNCYVGYTATPQGCLAADVNSTVGYPKDFLWLLETIKLPDDPKSTLSYMGLHEFFLQYHNDLVNIMSKNTWPHHVKKSKKEKAGIYNPLENKVIEKANLNLMENKFADALLSNLFPIPKEFIEATIYFILGAAIRWMRFRDKQNNSKAIPSIEEIRKNYPDHAMMYNLSLTKDNHTKTLNVIERTVVLCSKEFKKWVKNEKSTFRDIFLKQNDKTQKIKIGELIENREEEIKEFCEIAIKLITEPINSNSHFVYKLNSSAEGDALNYNDLDDSRRTKKCAIFLGGNILSRGLTINNLSVSVFIRSQATSLGDTNLQMCRWFGHKKKDIDLISLYIMEDVNNLFKSITRCDDAIRLSIKKSIIESKTPENVLIELWSSDLFSLTSPGKSRNLKIQQNSAISYSGKSREMRQPFCSNEINLLKNNLNLFNDYIETIKHKEIQNYFNRGTLFLDVDKEKLINFLMQLKYQKDLLFLSPTSYSEYLLEWISGYKNQTLNFPLPKINIGFMTGQKKDQSAERQREFSKEPNNLEEALLYKTETIGAILGGPQLKAQEKYLGDRFFDKNQDWHNENHDRIPDDREQRDSILILFYLISPNYLKSIKLNNKWESFYIPKDHQDFVDLKEILTFAAITPLGGPSYKVHTHTMINL